MQCPVCKKLSLQTVESAPGLTGLRCDACAGVWIPRTNYDAWHARLPSDLRESQAPAQYAGADAQQPKLCPQCGRLLLPYRVGHGLPFALDYCGACGGTWFDHGEWDAILARNLHGNLHDIITAHWQAAVREEEMHATIDRTYQRLLGPAYVKTVEFRTWLRAQPQKALILACLGETKP